MSSAKDQAQRKIEEARLKEKLAELDRRAAWCAEVFEKLKYRAVHESANLSHQDAVKLRDDYEEAWSSLEKARRAVERAHKKYQKSVLFQGVV